jgi:hypothetical protein
LSTKACHQCFRRTSMGVGEKSPRVRFGYQRFSLNKSEVSRIIIIS